MRGVHRLPVFLYLGAISTGFACVDKIIDGLLVALTLSSLFNEGIVGGRPLATFSLGVVGALAVDDLVLEELGEMTVVLALFGTGAHVFAEATTRCVGKHRRSKFAFTLDRGHLVSRAGANCNSVSIGFQLTLGVSTVSGSFLRWHHG